MGNTVVPAHAVGSNASHLYVQFYVEILYRYTIWISYNKIIGRWQKWHTVKWKKYQSHNGNLKCVCTYGHSAMHAWRHHEASGMHTVPLWIARNTILATCKGTFSQARVTLLLKKVKHEWTGAKKWMAWWWWLQWRNEWPEKLLVSNTTAWWTSRRTSPRQWLSTTSRSRPPATIYWQPSQSQRLGDGF